MGLLMISFLMFVLTIVGFFGFGKTPNDSFFAMYNGSLVLASFLAIVFLLIAIAQWLAGNKLVMIIFAMLAVFAQMYKYVAMGDGILGSTGNTMFFFVGIAIFMILLGLIAFLNKAGLMLTLLLLCAGLVFLFYGLLVNAFTNGNDCGTFALLIGVFALLSFVLSLWLTLAMETPLGLPVM